MNEGIRYLALYKPKTYLDENFKKNYKFRSYKSFFENSEKSFANKLMQFYVEEKENIKNIKKNYNYEVDPIRDAISKVIVSVKSLAEFFKKNTQYHETEEGIIFKTKKLDLIWSSQSQKDEFLSKFRELLQDIKEFDHEKYKLKYFSFYKFQVRFRPNHIEHISLFDYKDQLSSFVFECMQIFQSIFPDRFRYMYIDGKGSGKQVNVFWDDLDSIGGFFRLDIPSLIYQTILEDQQKDFEDTILPFLENRIRKFEREEQATSTYSFVYVLSNKSYPNTYKIGSTSGTPKDRAAELATTGVLHPFKVEFQIKMKDAEYYEINTHKILNKYRVKNNKEFFELELDKIKDCLQQVSILSEEGQRKVALADLKKKIKIK